MEEFSEHVQVALKQLIAKRDNYLGTLYRVEIISTDNDNGTKLNLICKIPSSDWGSEDNWQKIHIPYEREVYVYNVILKSFEKLQNDKNLNENQKFASYALCHVASDVNKKEFLILEDLHARNFVMFDKRKKMDFSHITLVAKGLAKYHALSFVMRDQQPEKFHKILKSTQPSRTKPITIPKFLNNDMINNMFIFLQDGKPVEICFIDWQIARFVSPVLDLLYFFYLSTDEDIFSKNYINSRGTRVCL
ncbi:uncharacterized protein LOC113371259 [Ctenocephalides felis]|uniref:uncharacterized protein LOC113371259 n=1 Tax=Ctenocephalides felis TaxID=7515 RepID=UPI000E6E1056|nr:uncharacterized protein LOC113371259 [Ctenocephalides felis]